MKPPIYIRLRMIRGKIAFLIDARATLMIALFLAIAFVLFLCSAGMGTMKIAPWDVLKSWFAADDDMNRLIVVSFRLPRIAVACLSGMALAAAGAILQGVVRNPLASPDLLGITGGASLFVVLFLDVFSNASNALTVSVDWLPVAAFLGAWTASAVIYLLAWKRGVSPIRLVLVGIGISAVMQSFTTLFMIMGPIYQASQANIWITGSVYGSNWDDVSVLFPWTAVLLILAFFRVRHLNVQELGESVATGLGSAVMRNRIGLLLLCTGLVGGAVAFAGGISFVGLVAPHISRKLVGSAFGALLPLSALVGAILVMAADLIGRTAFGTTEIPAGVFTAAIGAPYFIFLLYRYRNIR